MTTSATPAEPTATPAVTPATQPDVSAPREPDDLRPRSVRLGALLLALGSLISFALMSIDKQLTAGPLLGGIAITVAAFGVLELCGLLRALPTDELVLPRLFGAKPGEPAYLAPRITLPVALVIILLGRLILGPGAMFVPLLLAHFVLLLSAIRRPPLFVFTVSSLILLPMLGQFGLWDPWETHYGEVAREILARDDWITLWWAQDEWFRSKPVFIFWIEALAWGALAIPFGPDTNPGHPEWALRLPHYILSMGALMAAYALMARSFGKRAGIIAALVLATTPYFFFLSHQAITDMPFVATMTTAMALFGLAVEADPSAPLKSYRIGRFAVSWKGLLLAAFVLAALPQALYLITRNVGFAVVKDFGFWIHKDEFLFGSAGNSGIPGNPVHRMRGPYLKAIYYQPFAQGLLWLLGLAYLVRQIKRQRDAGTLAMFGFYLFCSFAWMAKGIPGFALPGLIAALYLFATKRWILLTSGRLRVGLGVLTIAVTGLPWYVAMYGRLGPFFTDRLLIHDHINRLASGVHGDTGSIQYFLQQLGYGMFPWFGLAPLGLVAFRLLKPSDAEDGGRERRTAILLALWMTASFALFNAMITKFHHYIFPAVPPLSLLIGLALERVLGDASADMRKERWAVALSLLAPVPLVIGIAGFYGNVRGIIPDGVATAQAATWMAENGLPTAVSVCLIAIGAALLFFALQLLGAFQDQNLRASSANASVGAALLAGAFLTAFAGRDLAWVNNGKPAGQERLIDLFVYNYERPFPEYLDYHPALTGFAVAAFVLLLVASGARLRKVGIYALLGVSFWFAIWGLDVHMVDLSPHWGQRELIKRYYEDRRSDSEPLIAWQMNWKGENLYTGNRTHVYVDLDNKAVEKWMTDHANTQAFFLLEHSRLGNFKRMLGKRRVEELSTLRENNKFILVRAYL